MERTSRKLGPSVVKAGVLLPIIQHARKSDIPIDALLRRAHLPANFGEDRTAIVSTASWHALYDQLSRETGTPDVGWQVGISSRLSAFSQEFTQGMASAPSLFEALRFASRFGTRHCTSHQVSIRTRGDFGYVIHSNGGDRLPGAGQRSLARTGSIVLVVREFLGDDWQPDVVAVNAAPSELPTDGSFEGTRVICRPGYDMVRLPRKALAARCRSPIITNNDQGTPIPGHITARLENLLKPCLIDACPGIAGMAEMLGTSPRSLQRRLTEAGTCYSEIVQRVRYKVAAEMLRDSDMRVIDVANTLGYEDASHFSRFFRRIAGITPRRFRSLHREGVFDYQAAG
jgi:AraC-like DNA-binding protein